MWVSETFGLYSDGHPSLLSTQLHRLDTSVAQRYKERQRETGEIIVDRYAYRSVRLVRKLPFEGVTRLLLAN